MFLFYLGITILAGAALRVSERHLAGKGQSLRPLKGASVTSSTVHAESLLEGARGVATASDPIKARQQYILNNAQAESAFEKAQYTSQHPLIRNTPKDYVVQNHINRELLKRHPPLPTERINTAAAVQYYARSPPNVHQIVPFF
jgi:hypothetical protein